jgi:hypothetical protein
VVHIDTIGLEMGTYPADTVTELLYATISWSKKEKMGSNSVLHQLLVSTDDVNLQSERK